MIKTCLFFLVLFTTHAFGQDYRAIYDLHYKRDSTSTDRINMKMVLDIQNGDSKFFFEKLLKLDSLYKKNVQVSISIPLQQMVKRKTGSFENQNFVSVDESYYTFTSQDKINWKISDSTKQFQHYKLQKATAYWGGRNWIAWFSSEIPISEGPYKFTGLPGLVMEISDVKNNFRYKLISLKRANETLDTKNIVESNLGLQPIKITLEKYQKLLLNRYNNPFSDYKTLEDGSWNLIIFDKKISTAAGLKDITKEYQNDLKKKYNPLELDKKINYK